MPLITTHTYTVLCGANLGKDATSTLHTEVTISLFRYYDHDPQPVLLTYES